MGLQSLRRGKQSRNRFLTPNPFEYLESRVLLDALDHHDDFYPGILSDAATSVTATPTYEAASAISISSMPKYHSRASAAAKIFLDFDGSPAMNWGNYSAPAQLAYSSDADRTTYSDAEQAQIYETWQRVAEKFSPFDIDVTTEDPGNRTALKTLTVIMASDGGAWLGNSPGGHAYISSFSTGTASASVFVFPVNLGPYVPKYMAEAAAHEAGHALGLRHQSTYDANGTRTQDYSTGTGTGAGSIAPTMGNSYSSERGVWWKGTNSVSSTTIQDDLAVITGNNGFTYRVDDHANTVSSATPLTISGSAVSGRGVIERSTDADYFSFSTNAGTINFTVNSAAKGAMLNLKLELRTSTGTLVTSKNAQTLGETLSYTVSTGAYRLVVASNGAYGDLGQYSITGTIIPPTNLVNAPSNLAAATSAGKINLSWTDNATNETSYVVQRSTDGVNFTTLTTLAASTVTYSDLAVSAGNSYQYRVFASNGTINSDTSNVASATLAPVAPTGLTATPLTGQINLAWTDVSGETGYRIERSLDGITFSQIATVGAGVTSYSNTGLNQNTRYYYRIFASNAGGSSAASSVVSALTPTQPVPGAPTNLTLTAGRQRRIQLRWNDNSSIETGYRVEQSTDGINFTQIASLAANTTTFTTNRLNGGQTYWFRVYAYNAVGKSGYSNVAQMTAQTSGVKALAFASESTATQETSDIRRVRITPQWFASLFTR